MAKQTELMKKLLRYDRFTMHREELDFPQNSLRELMSCFYEEDIMREATGEILERMICAFPDRKSVCETARLMKVVNLTDYLLRRGYVVPKEGGGYKLEGFSESWNFFLENLDIDSKDIILRADYLEVMAEIERPVSTTVQFRTILDAFSHLEFIMEKLWEAETDRQYSDKSFSLEVPMVYYQGLYRRLAKDVGKALVYMTELGDKRARPIFVGLTPLNMNSLWEVCKDEEARGLSGEQAVVTRELLGKIAEEGYHYQLGPCRSMMASFDWDEELDNWEKVLLVAQTQRMRRMGVEGAGVMIHKLLKREKSHFGLAGLMLRFCRQRVKRGETVALWEVNVLERYFNRIMEQIDLELKEDRYVQPEYYDTRGIYALYLDWIAEMRAAVAPEETAAPVEAEKKEAQPVKEKPAPDPKPAPAPQPAPKPAPQPAPKPVPKPASKPAPKPAPAPAPKPAAKPDPKPAEKKKEKAEKPVSKPLAFIKGGVAIALLIFLLFSPAAAFLWTEEAMIIVKFVVIVICAILGAIIGGFGGFCSGGVGAAVVMLVLPYFVELDTLIKIVLALVLGGYGLYQLIAALTAPKKTEKKTEK